MAKATINTEEVRKCVGIITDEMSAINEMAQKHSTTLDSLATQTNIKPIVSLASSFNVMLVQCKKADASMQETKEKTQRYCAEADEINSDESGLYN